MNPQIPVVVQIIWTALPIVVVVSTVLALVLISKTTVLKPTALVWWVLFVVFVPLFGSLSLFFMLWFRSKEKTKAGAAPIESSI